MRSPLASPFRGGWRNLTPMRGRGGAGPEPYVTTPVYVRTADKAALDITGDIEIVVRVAPTAWTGAARVLVAKETTASTRSFRFALGSTTPLLTISTDGSALSGPGSASTGVPFSAGQAGWVKVTRRQSDGRVQFFTAADQTPEPASFSQLGTDQTLAAGSAIFSSSSVLEICSRGGGATETLAGKLYRMILRSGIGGTVVADFNAALLGSASSYADAYGNTWTVG